MSKAEMNVGSFSRTNLPVVPWETGWPLCALVEQALHPSSTASESPILLSEPRLQFLQSFIRSNSTSCSRTHNTFPYMITRLRLLLSFLVHHLAPNKFCGVALPWFQTRCLIEE
jgi:hypothetical protein